MRCRWGWRRDACAWAWPRRTTISGPTAWCASSPTRWRRPSARALQIAFEAIEPSVAPSLAAVERGEQQRRQGAAEAAIAADPLVQDLMNRFDARVVPNSTRPSRQEN